LTANRGERREALAPVPVALLAIGLLTLLALVALATHGSAEPAASGASIDRRVSALLAAGALIAAVAGLLVWLRRRRGGRLPRGGGRDTLSRQAWLLLLLPPSLLVLVILLALYLVPVGPPPPPGQAQGGMGSLAPLAVTPAAPAATRTGGEDVTLTVILAIAGIPLFVFIAGAWMRRSGAARAGERRPISTPERLQFVMPLLFLVGFYVVLALKSIGPAAPPAPSIPSSAVTSSAPTTAFHPPEVGRTALPLGAVLVAGCVAVFVLRARWRPSHRPVVTVPDGATPLDATSSAADMVEMGIDQLRGEPDPRRAVIAAYVSMERTLERRGVARQRSDAPFGYLERALRQASVDGPAATSLTALFEQARFNRQAILPGMRDSALQALLTIREELPARAG